MKKASPRVPRDTSIMGILVSLILDVFASGHTTAQKIKKGDYSS